MSADAASKGAHFVQLCCQRKIPLIFLQNTTSDVTEVNSVEQGRNLKKKKIIDFLSNHLDIADFFYLLYHPVCLDEFHTGKIN